MLISSCPGGSVRVQSISSTGTSAARFTPRPDACVSVPCGIDGMLGDIVSGGVSALGLNVSAAGGVVFVRKRIRG